MLGEEQVQYTGRHEGLTVRFKDVSALFAGCISLSGYVKETWKHSSDRDSRRYKHAAGAQWKLGWWWNHARMAREAPICHGDVTQNPD